MSWGSDSKTIPWNASFWLQLAMLESFGPTLALVWSFVLMKVSTHVSMSTTKIERMDPAMVPPSTKTLVNFVYNLSLMELLNKDR